MGLKGWLQLGAIVFLVLAFCCWFWMKQQGKKGEPETPVFTAVKLPLICLGICSAVVLVCCILLVTLV